MASNSNHDAFRVRDRTGRSRHRGHGAARLAPFRPRSEQTPPTRAPFQRRLVPGATTRRAATGRPNWNRVGGGPLEVPHLCPSGRTIPRNEELTCTLDDGDGTVGAVRLTPETRELGDVLLVMFSPPMLNMRSEDREAVRQSLQVCASHMLVYRNCVRENDDPPQDELLMLAGSQHTLSVCFGNTIYNHAMVVNHGVNVSQQVDAARRHLLDWYLRDLTPNQLQRLRVMFVLVPLDYAINYTQQGIRVTYRNSSGVHPV